MDKKDFKKYYCRSCDEFFDEPVEFTENRCPYGEKSDSSWIETLEGCPNCHSGLELKYYCPKCEKATSSLEYYPYAEEYMCDDCYEEMMENGELVEEAMEGVIKNDEPRGLIYEEEN